jgi:2-polyprenyl-6-hydroxyphenyl methylase/3-demethylubiquinone-9 3-methyltransferase
MSRRREEESTGLGEPHKCSRAETGIIGRRYGKQVCSVARQAYAGTTVGIAAGDVRFAFGRNWELFLQQLTEENIREAERSLVAMLGRGSLRGATFLDIGSGSGLTSLAAHRLGARVHSFDYDARCVACTAELRRRHSCGSPTWSVERGSVLDKSFMASLGTFEIVCSWGVLHHTGDMWQALENAMLPVATPGTLYIAIYNDQGRASQFWLLVKQTYNALPVPLRFLVAYPVAARLWGPRLMLDTLHGSPLRTWRSYGTTRRGMSPWRDVVDWAGGLPFEVATPEAVFAFCHQRGFALERLTTKGGGIGCNEYVFRRE